LITGVAVEKGTKAVISVNFSVYSRRTFNSLRTNFAVEFPSKEFFNSYAWLQQLWNPVPVGSKVLAVKNAAVAKSLEPCSYRRF
jgi:hypothetical protein